MKKKIVLFLSSAPNEGGTYQYNLSILHAFLSFSDEKWEKVIYYTHPDWYEVLKGFQIKKTYLKVPLLSHLIRKILLKLSLPLNLYRKYAHFFYTPIQIMYKEGAHLWIYPSQDRWSYEAPFPALTAVHDLMHRYEKNFPEVSGNGEFDRREKHYNALCFYSKGILVDSLCGKNQVIESYSVLKNKIYILPYIPPRYIFDLQNKDLPQPENIPYPYILYPAQFWEHKNHSRLLDAFFNAHKKNSNLFLVLTGGEKNRMSAIKRQIESLGLQQRVKILGYVSNEKLCALYKHAKGLIFPTFFGPTNIPPLEALSFGCPVAVSDIYGMKEQLGSHAIYFNPNSISEIENALLKLWDKEQTAHETHIEKFIKESTTLESSFLESLESICRSLT